MATDVLFINPGNAQAIYQGLASTVAAIEPPTWALLLAESCRSQGNSVAILDANAERLSIPDQVMRVRDLSPRLVVFVVYGQNVNAGTANMSGAIELSSALKVTDSNIKIAYVGSYVQALPVKALTEEPSIDFCFTNEGVYALWEVLKIKDFNTESLAGIKGIAYRQDNSEIKINLASPIVPTRRMDLDLPGYAWDLLPFKYKPLDLYRAPAWHANYNEALRSPYAAIQTSLGCNFGCSFCMINILNRNDESEVGVASTYKGMRFWSTEFVLKQFDILSELGVKTIKITDEMFLLYKKHYVPLCTELSKKPYAKDLMMWSYSRIDTVTDPEFLKVVRSAGIRWLALGIESADKSVRLEVTKGNFEDVDIERVVKQVEDAGINVMANYIVGLPGDDAESMKRTLKFSKKLNTAGWNMYAAMALPGSELYKYALENDVELPNTYSAFSFHSENTLPLRTELLTAAEILRFRDESFIEYHSSEEFKQVILNKFGQESLNTMIETLKYKLKRNLYS
jgi:anaerobic magnesium-protoporphyrin IX monomethyl ester cyclase